MTYPVGAQDRGWLWEHRVMAAAVCLLVIATGSLLLNSGVMPFSPLGLLLIVMNVAAALVVVVLVLLWLSTTASNLPHDAKPAT